MSREDQIIERVESIKPLLAGLTPDIQGAILADLTAIWLSGHPPQCRDDIIAHQLKYIKLLLSINDQIMFGPAGHPSTRQSN